MSLSNHPMLQALMLALASNIPMEMAIDGVEKAIKQYKEKGDSEATRVALYAACTVVTQKGEVEKLERNMKLSKVAEAELKQKDPKSN